MAKRKLDTTKLNTTRLALVQKGFLTRGDIQAFVPCGKNKAAQIFNEIRSDVKSEGLENCSKVILAKRILNYMVLTAEGITAAAKLESKR